MTFARGFPKICYQFCANPTVAIEASGGVKLSMALLLVLLLHPGCYPSAIGLGGNSRYWGNMVVVQGHR